MKIVLVLILALLSVILLSDWHPLEIGKVSFFIEGYRISVDFGFICFLVLIIFIFFHLSLMVLNLLVNFFYFRVIRLKQKASYNLASAMIHRGLGDLKKAEKLFLKKAKHGELPEAHFIAAAEIAHQRKDLASRDFYLEKASGFSGSKNLPIAIVKKFEWMIEEEKFDSAIKVLEGLGSQLKKNNKMIALQKLLFEKTGNYQKILDMLSDLRRLPEYDNNYLKQLELSCAINILNEEQFFDETKSRKKWLSFSKDIRQRPPLIAVYTSLLLRSGFNTEAEKILKRRLDESLNNQLLEIYGSIKSEKPKRMLRAIQYWRTKYGESSELEMAAAQQCINATMWGQAKNHLMKIIDDTPTPVALKLMADIEEQLGNHGLSLVRRRQGLELAAKEK